LELLLVDSRVGWIKPYLALWMRLQISKDTKRLFQVPGLGHREVAQQQQCLQKDIARTDLNCPSKLANEVLEALYVGF
jgi:hypothetical protein